jgi:hypothetical protein
VVERKETRKEAAMPKYGILSYDIPAKNRSANRRLLKKIRRISVMESWSCYLVPWGYYDTIKTVMTEEQADTPGIRFSIRPYDSSADEEIETSVLEAMRRNLQNQKDSLGKTLMELENAMDENIPSEVDAIELCPAVHRAIKRSNKHLEDAKAAALAFAMSDNMFAAFVAFEELIQASVEDFKAKKALLKETD